MDDFKNVSVVKKANVYFDGKVTSRTVVLASGERKTLGIMLPGEYTFSTGVAETMELLAGSMDVRLPGSTSFKTFTAGESFEVPGKASFDLVVREVADYCCSYGR